MACQLCVIAPFKEVTHDTVLPIDVVTDLQHLPVLNVMSVSVFSSDVTGVAVEETCDDNNDDDVVLNADQLPAGGCVSGGTDIKQLEERDDSLSVCWEVARTAKGYLAERIGECVRFLLHLSGWYVVYGHFIFLCLIPGGDGRQPRMRPLFGLSVNLEGLYATIRLLWCVNMICAVCVELLLVCRSRM